ncbi:cell division protein ZapA [Bacteroidales bacterium OttesenSCG-928-K03]|nr:cell division protein ZapA [Odoribacter sp. OttesenSCG-928-L07]MDL2239710.1 cell division protein ZapA [Bacteroidales bacterium OttesenSCG-928-L14]MDL2242940.1 cell division protein ZapA [Bacteroidales bacterium OttesenSCG-928-K03]
MADIIKTININILGRIYPLNVTEKNEQVVIHAQSELNKLIEHYKVTYAYKDDKDLLAMSAIQFAIKTVILDKLQNNKEDNNVIIERLIEIEKLFDEITN